MSKTKILISAVVAIILLVIGGIFWVYQQTPGGVGLPNFSWPDSSEDNKQQSCGGTETCPDGYTCQYDQGAELGTCVKNIKQKPAKMTCGGIDGLECPEGYYCDWKVEAGMPDRWGECKPE